MWGATRKRAQPLKGKQFQSTRPVWGATYPPEGAASAEKNFNPRAPCGARRRDRPDDDRRRMISIHAPRVGRDSMDIIRGGTNNDFNPRAPCGARPKRLSGFSTNHLLFQSTRPVWGATGTSCTVTGRTAKFQSTRPVWGATMVKDALDEYEDISIHAPRVGRDRESISRLETLSHFNPRAPCGARQKYWMARTKRISISIHAPRVGRDQRVSQYCAGVNAFQSTRPVWGATMGTMVKSSFL